jgi:hypothetical protein
MLMTVVKLARTVGNNPHKGLFMMLVYKRNARQPESLRVHQLHFHTGRIHSRDRRRAEQASVALISIEKMRITPR